MSQQALGSEMGPRAAALRPGLLARSLRRWLEIAVHVALWVWAIDVLRLLRESEGAGDLLEIGRGLLGALFRAFLVTLVPALGIGAARWLSELQRGWLGRPAWLERARAYLNKGAAQQQLAKAGALVALGPLAGLGLWTSVRICERLITGMARPLFAAMACVAACASVLLVAGLLWPAAAALGTALCSGLSRSPGLGRRCFSRTWHFAAWLSLAVAVALGYVVYRFREPLSFLPWPLLVQLMAAVGAGSVTAWLARRLPDSTRALRLGLDVVLVLGALAVAAAQSPLAVRSRQIAETETVSGRLGQRLLLWAWDSDHDGYLPAFGGGDCAPHDAGRNPGSTDVPGNGIDEDCDGADLDPSATALRGKYDYPVPSEVPKRPPIVLITVDAFAAGHMHSLGYERDLTPNIDAFAARSVFFRQCYAQGPSTRLSFPSMFTSRWDTQIEQELVGHHPFPIGKHEKLLAEVLQEAGYDTTAILSDGYFSPRFWRGITRGFSEIVESPFTEKPKLNHNGARVTEAALEALQAPRQRPLFLWVHYYDAHSPHHQPGDVPVYGKTRKDVYDAELRLVDREVGKLLRGIEAHAAEQAIVVLTGDHGIAFDEPRHAKFNYGYDLYSAVLHVPLIVHAAFLSPRALDSVVSTMDIAPTLANLLRLKANLPYEGVSLVPELFSGKSSRPPELMHQMFIEERKWKQEEPLERVSLRTNRFDLLQDRKTGFVELYDYRNDYFETRDLALEPQYAPTLSALRKQLTVLLYNAQPDAPQAGR